MNIKRKILLCISVLMLAVLVVSRPVPEWGTGNIVVPVYADEKADLEQKMKDLQDKLKEIQETIKQSDEDIKNNKNAAAAAEARAIALEQEAAILKQQIELKHQEISRQEQAISTKDTEIQQKQIEFDENDKLFNERLVAIYKMNNSSVLSTLLSVSSFSEFLTVSKTLQEVSKYDTDMLETLEAQRQSLENDRTELQNMMVTLEQERDGMDVKMGEYNTSISNAKAEKDAAVAAIEQSESEKDAAIKEREAMQAEMEEVWKQLGSSSTPYIGGDLLWPCPNYNGKNFISSYYGWRTLYGRQNFHTGIDIAGGGIHGTDIVAANGGQVIYVMANSNAGYGNYVILDHGGGIRTLYAHCSAIYVGVGQWVSSGDTIAAVGNTGNSTGPHLHFEVRINNTEKVNPLPYLSGEASLY